MIYRVEYNGINIYDEDDDMILLNPSVETELNSAGSFEYTMPTKHAYYTSPSVLTPDVDVYEDNNLIFFGRPVSLKKNWNNEWKVHCEGALAYFNDSVQRPHEYFEYSVRQFFRDVIANHNQLVPANRRFTVGNITVQDKLVYRKLNYEKTWNVLKEMCLDAEGGYLFTRKDENRIYIDWIAEMPYTTNQPVQFALNLVDLNQYIDGSDIVTSVIPLGDVDQNTGERVTIKSVNDTKDYLDSAAVSSYGRITEAVIFNGVTDPQTLKDLGQDWLTNKQFDRLTIECDAAELHYLNPDMIAYKLGQIVHVASTPHLINRDFPLSKMSINLDSGVKKITIGTEPRKDLTEIYQNDY